MKIFLSLIFLACISFTSRGQFDNFNINLLDSFNDPSVQAEPVYGIRYQSCWGYVDSLGNEYGIIGSTAGSYIIDVTNPTNLVQHTYIPHRQNDCIWHEYKTYENYLYIISDDSDVPPNSLQIVDMRYLPDSVHMVYDDSSIFVRAHTQFIEGMNWYLASVKLQGGIHYSMAVYSLADPENPVLKRALNDDFPLIDAVHDMFVIHDTIYASCGYQGLFIFKYDEQNNQFIQLGALLGAPDHYNHSSYISKDHSTLYVTEEVPGGLPVQIVDITDVANTSVIDTFTTHDANTPHNPYVFGDYLILAAYNDGVWIYNISDPHNPVMTGYFDSHPQNDTTYDAPYAGAWAAYTDLPSGVLLISDMQYGLFALDMSVALGIKQSIPMEQEGMMVFPNPSRSEINIKFDGIENEAVSVSLYSMDGKKVLDKNFTFVRTGEKYNITTSDLPAGIYTLQASDQKNIFVKRISILK